MAALSPQLVDAAVSAYILSRPKYVSFAASLETLVTTLLDASALRYQQVTSRAKEADSFRNKITREGKDYADPCLEVTDLCGVRVVCYDTITVPQIDAIIRKNFVVDDANSVDKRTDLDPDRFGYLSVHYVVRLDSRREQLPEYAPFAAMRAEIQVRTALQHAWAALDHGLRYKATADAPKTLHRRLYRISALLELADDEFSRLLEEADSVRATYSADVSAGKLGSIEINADSVDSFLRDEPNHIQELSLSAATAGFALAPPPPTQKTPWTTLVRTLDLAGIGTLLGFKEALRLFAPEAKQTFKSIAKLWGEETASPRLVLDPSTLLRIAVILSLGPDHW